MPSPYSQSARALLAGHSVTPSRMRGMGGAGVVTMAPPNMTGRGGPNFGQPANAQQPGQPIVGAGITGSLGSSVGGASGQVTGGVLAAIVVGAVLAYWWTRGYQH